MMGTPLWSVKISRSVLQPGQTLTSLTGFAGLIVFAPHLFWANNAKQPIFVAPYLFFYPPKVVDDFCS
jgi:hypothetical protein